MPGDELLPVICSAIDRNRVEIKDGDILVIASKVVAKAAGRLAQAAGRAQFEELVDRHSHGVVAARSFSSQQGTATVAIVRTGAGTVQAAAGLDQSNADGSVVLHPSDPDGAAAELRAALERYFGVRLGVIISDTTSRPWRLGVSDFALGASGVRGLDSQRGRPDDSGRIQQVTERAVADEIAAAADLVKGAARGLPVAVVRGLGDLLDPEHPGARELNREEADDWFRHGHVEAVHTALGSEPASPPASADGDDDMLKRVSRALAAARGIRPRTPGQDHWRMRVTGAGSRILITPSGSGGGSEAGGHRLVEAAIGLGALVDRLHSALFAEELGARVRYTWSSNGAPSGAELTIELVMEDA
jgi:coenzyme F420-0:L-glutamate ligase / coenzyme F420-1:gamma-L-glutamate ligase